MTSPIVRQPAGTSAGGRFAPTDHPEGEVDLDDDAPFRQVIELQYVGGGSSKFYRFTTDGLNVRFQSGKIGTFGVEQANRDFATAEEAAAFVAEKFEKQRKKGYKLVPSASGGGETAVADHIDIDESVLPQKAMIVDPDDVEELLQSAEYVAQPKLDGERVLMAIRSGAVAPFSSKGLPKQTNVGEAHLAAFRHLKGDWSFDGEIVGQTFHVFDLVAAPGMASDAPFEERYRRLEQAIAELGADPDVVRIVRTAVGTEAKRALRADAKASLGEGVIFRKSSAVVEPGRKTTGLIKDKFRKEADVFIGEIHPTKDSAKAYVRGADGKPQFVGNISTRGHTVKVGDVVEARFKDSGADRSIPRMNQANIVRLRDPSEKTAEDCALDQFEFAFANKAWTGEDDESDD